MKPGPGNLEPDSDLDDSLSAKKCLQKKAGRRSRKSWKPVSITASTRVDKYEFCRLCMRHFGVFHGGFSVVTVKSLHLKYNCLKKPRASYNAK